MKPRDIKVGRRVYWNDPDSGICSAWGTVLPPAPRSENDIVLLKMDAGGETECYPRELSPSEYRRWRFAIYGTIETPRNFLPDIVQTEDGEEVVALELPDGSTIDLAMCLRQESPDGALEEFIVSEADMAKLGFVNLEYTGASFEEGGDA